MPQLLLLGLAGLGVYAAAKWWQAERGRVNAKLSKVRTSRSPGSGTTPTPETAKDVGTLRQDPQTGVYRPD